ncbi:MAG: MBL fold metallo-hydrolase [Prevotellaceae bacterium]|jgi:glyoxylase-like metal-dependent hydrolase (beta-lactamase superfamily II)|nr:MBL fold metallo-hydrolase [Prevotellaceae bacterium]
MKKNGGLLLFVTTVLGVLPATAQQVQEIFTYQSLPVTVSVLPEVQQTGDPSTLIGATPGMLDEYAPGGVIPSAVNAFLIYRYGQWALIDAGFGTRLFEHLQTFDITAEDISVVLLTHLHGDHIGGLLRSGKAAFPNATVYLSKQEYDYWTSDDAMNELPAARRGGFENARKTLAAYRDRLLLFEPAKIGAAVPREVIPGVHAIAAFGHTPGHTLYGIDLGAEYFLAWADLTHATAIQLPYPDVAVTYDVNPGQAIASRKEILDYVAKNTIPVAGSHVAFPGAGWVFENNRGGYVFQPAATSDAIRNAVTRQLKKYPGTRLADIYKNFFQDYFGPGHIISDAAAAKNYLQRELDALSETSGAAVEPTGCEGNFYRVNLSLVKENIIPFDVFLDAFIESANARTAPSPAVWAAQWDKIEQVLDGMQQNLPDYDTDKVKLHESLLAGQPVVHHSGAYNGQHQPHYRIISKSVFDKKLRKLLESRHVPSGLPEQRKMSPTQ